MPRIAYVERKFFRRRIDELIRKIEGILEEYVAQGYILTVRQLYYQLVARDILRNTFSNYKLVVRTVADARLAGLIDWEHIQDLTRELRELSHWDDPESVVESAARSFRLDKWEDQDHRLEVWVEKDALRNVVERACSTHDIPFFSCRGYASLSEMWAASQRLISYEKEGRTPIILHLGDHDPSGIDMTRDIEDRLRTFGCSAKIVRLGLNMPQVKKYNPPPNPAKATDARFKDYAAQFGEKCWELDALEPKILTGLIDKAVGEYIDQAEFDRRVDLEEEGRNELKLIVENYPAIVKAAKLAGKRKLAKAKKRPRSR